MSKITEVQHYFDDETGKTLAIAPTDEYTVKRTEVIENQREYFERMDAMKRDNRHFVRCYHEPILELNALLAVNELGTIAKLLPYIRMNSGGKLYYEGERMGIAEVRKAIGKGQRQAATLVKALVDHEVLIADYDGKRLVYSVNERFHIIGHASVKSYYTKVYQIKLKSDLKNVSIQAAGVLYKALPFFHYSRYYLCSNPNAGEGVEDIRHLTQRKFAELVNVDRKVVDRAIKELARNGFLMIMEAFGASVIMVNPDVMFRQQAANEYTEFVRYQFKQAGRSAIQNGVDIAAEELPF